MKPHVQKALATLHQQWTRSELSLLVADVEHFHDEIEDELGAAERAEFLDMKDRLSRLLAVVNDLLPEDATALTKHEKRTVLLTKQEDDSSDDE